MKRKAESLVMEFLSIYGWAILATLIVIGVFALCLRPLPEEFVVTKQECWNETNFQKGYCVEESIDCSWVEYYKGYIIEGHCADEGWVRDCEIRNATICDFYGLVIKRENATFKKQLCTYDSYEFCEQVEVDFGDWIENICNLADEDCGDYQISRFKKDLTREWLDENCMNRCSGESYQVSDEGCAKQGWKCGDYIIEVRE